jgi:xanthosine phosphorylase
VFVPMTAGDTALSTPDAAAAFVAARMRGPAPRVGLILGSGLGGVAAAIEAPLILPFAAIPGFPRTTVEGHAGRLVIGRLGGLPVACLEGRVHIYEGAGPAEIQLLVRTLRRLGCETLVLTNAAGALRPAMRAGSLMLLADHISLLPFNPLTGPNDDSFGPRFPSMDRIYDPELRAAFRAVAAESGIVLHEGVYVACLGPSFETPAEVLALSRLGGDAVGMSTVPEAIVAVHCGMRVAAISALVSPAAGLTRRPPSHEATLATGALAAAALERLLIGFLKRLPHPPGAAPQAKAP